MIECAIEDLDSYMWSNFRNDCFGKGVLDEFICKHLCILGMHLGKFSHSRHRCLLLWREFLILDRLSTVAVAASIVAVVLSCSSTATKDRPRQCSCARNIAEAGGA